MQNKLYRCCITGHPPNQLPFDYDETCEDCIQLKMKLAVEIEKMRKKGVTTFLAGMAQGTGIWGAEIVLDLKRAYPGEPIRVVAVLANKKQVNRWTEKYRKRYFDILTKTDQTITPQPHYTKNHLRIRSRFMVDVCAHLIAVFNGKPGQIKYTVNYARKNGLEIVLINPNDMTKTTRVPPKPDHR